MSHFSRQFGVAPPRSSSKIYIERNAPTFTSDHSIEYNTKKIVVVMKHAIQLVEIYIYIYICINISLCSNSIDFLIRVAIF